MALGLNGHSVADSGLGPGSLALWVNRAADILFGLAIESSNPSASDNAASGNGPGVAIARVRPLAGHFDVLEKVLIEPLRRETGHDDLLPAIDRLCNKAGAQPRQIGLICVSAGPGGFTALRVAVTAAKMIAFSTAAACSAVPSAWVAARRAGCAGRFAVLLAGKGDSAFATVFDPGWESGVIRSAPIGRLVRAEDVAGLNVGAIVADRFLPEPIRAAVETLGIPIESPRFDPGACLELGCLLRAGGPGSLNPIYPREPEAVTLWKARNRA